jgi:hypothetical protein
VKVNAIQKKGYSSTRENAASFAPASFFLSNAILLCPSWIETSSSRERPFSPSTSPRSLWSNTSLRRLGLAHEEKDETNQIAELEVDEGGNVAGALTFCWLRSTCVDSMITRHLSTKQENLSACCSSPCHGRRVRWNSIDDRLRASPLPSSLVCSRSTKPSFFP